MATPSRGSNSALQRVLQPLTSLLPFGRDKSYLSLDIGSSSVKMIEAQGRGSTLNILGAGIAPLPIDAVQGNLVQDPESVAEAILTLIDENQAEATDAIIAIPGPSVIIKRATFPAQESKELQETILFEAGNYIPESLDDVNLDYQVLEHSTEADNVDVLLVAVRKDVINSYLAPIHEAGLVPAIVDVDYFALENMFEVNYSPEPEESIALLNIGARYSSINIIKEGRSAFTGDVPTGGRRFTELLAQELGISEDQAEKVKTSSDSGYDKGQIEQIVASAAEQFLDEVQRALSFFWTSSTKDQISSLCLSGGAAQLPGLAAAVHQRLQVPVEEIDPFRLLNLGTQVDEQFLRDNALALAVCVGLATRRPGDHR